MAELGLAIVWITPAMDGPFDPAKSGDRFEKMMKDLAAVSGYRELEFAPIAPIGHSAAASYPWNFAAWAPQRTLAVLSIHGDAPETPLAGFGRPHASGGDRTIDGVPGLMAMGEYEWIEARLAPAMVYRVAHPKAAIAVLAEPGQGHFAACDDLVRFVAMFVQKCVEQRLPALADTPMDKPPVLTPIDPSKGWLVERWFLNSGRSVEPGPFGKYAGDSVDAFWAFDQEMAMAIQNYHVDQIGKRPQLIGFVQNGQIVPATATHPMENLKFLPMEDGETFKLEARFLDIVSSMGADEGCDRGRITTFAGRALRLVAQLVTPVAGGRSSFNVSKGRSSRPRRTRSSLVSIAGRRSVIRQSGYARCTREMINTNRRCSRRLSIFRRNDARNGSELSCSTKFRGTRRLIAGSVKLSASSRVRDCRFHFFVREGPAEVDGHDTEAIADFAAGKNIP